MKKGQKTEKNIKSILKFLKMNEETISTLLGGVVIVLVVGMVFNYLKFANLKVWQGKLLEDQVAMTSDNTSNINTERKTVGTYTVTKGDTLWSIAEKHYKSGYNYVDIARENKVKPEAKLEVGTILVIPDVTPKKMTQPEGKKPIVTLSESGDVVIKTGEYTTKRGDTYWKIAVRSYGDGFKWTKIYWANKKIFANPDLIHADVKIVIPELEK